jgi:hypothetical protein
MMALSSLYEENGVSSYSEPKDSEQQTHVKQVLKLIIFYEIFSVLSRCIIIIHTGHSQMYHYYYNTGNCFVLLA